jgi:hypothetical protein
MRARAWAVTVAATLAAACGGSTPPAPADVRTAAVDPGQAATIKGYIRFTGPPLAAETVRIDADRACVALAGSDQQSLDRVLVGEDSGVQDVFVYIKSGLEKITFPVPSEPVVIEQEKCRYVPRVVGVRVGQPLHIRNGDPLLHNVRSDSEINQPFNQGQPVQGMVFAHTFTTREVMVPVKCDVHAWMRTSVGALEHPYFAVTGGDGEFSLRDLPPGTYTLAAWHDTLGTLEQTVTLAAKESRDVELTFAR